MSPKSEKVSSVECRVSRPVTHHASRITYHGFTLIELMVVVSIMAVMLAIGIPSLRKVWEQGTMQRTLTDIQEVCSHARADAILQGVTTEVVFHPKDGRIEIAAGAAPRPAQNGPDGQVNPYSVYNNGVEMRSEETVVVGGAPAAGGGSSAAGSGRSAQIPQSVV